MTTNGWLPIFVFLGLIFLVTTALGVPRFLRQRLRFRFRESRETQNLRGGTA